MENSSLIVKYRIAMWSYNPLVSIHTKVLKTCKNIHNSQQMDTTQMSIKSWVDKQMCYSHTVEYYPAIKGMF